REVLHDAVVAELEVPRGDLEPEGHEAAVDGLDLGDLLLDGDVRELSLLRDGPVHLDRVFVGERDLRLPTRSFRDLHGVVHDRAHVRLRAGVRGRKSEGAVDEDAYPDPAVVAHVERVEDPVLQDEILLLLLLVTSLRVRGSLLPRIVDRKIDEVHLRIHAAPLRESSPLKAGARMKVSDGTVRRPNP